MGYLLSVLVTCLRRERHGNWNPVVYKQAIVFFLLLIATTVFFISFQMSSVVTPSRYKSQPPPNTTHFESWFTAAKMDDPQLVSAIARHFVHPPAPANSKYNFSTAIWKSPITKVVMSLFENKTKGFFIECGAFDGEWISNTVQLEQEWGWTGLLIETDPVEIPKLLSKKRKAWIAPVCLSTADHPAEMTMLRHKEWGAVSKISTNITVDSEHGAFPFQFKVPCFHLYSLMLAINQTEVDYFSLDVEAREWEIIKRIPFDKLKFKVISVETSPVYRVVSDFLKGHGYWLVQEVNAAFVHDGIFVHNSFRPNPKQ